MLFERSFWKYFYFVFYNPNLSFFLDVITLGKRSTREDDYVKLLVLSSLLKSCNEEHKNDQWTYQAPHKSA